MLRRNELIGIATLLLRSTTFRSMQNKALCAALDRMEETARPLLNPCPRSKGDNILAILFHPLHLGFFQGQRARHCGGCCQRRSGSAVTEAKTTLSPEVT